MADLDSYCVPRESNKCEFYTITNETVSFSPQRSCGRARHWIGLDRILSYLRGTLYCDRINQQEKKEANATFVPTLLNRYRRTNREPSELSVSIPEPLKKKKTRKKASITYIK